MNIKNICRSFFSNVHGGELCWHCSLVTDGFERAGIWTANWFGCCGIGFLLCIIELTTEADEAHVRVVCPSVPCFPIGSVEWDLSIVSRVLCWIVHDQRNFVRELWIYFFKEVPKSIIQIQIQITLLEWIPNYVCKLDARHQQNWKNISKSLLKRDKFHSQNVEDVLSLYKRNPLWLAVSTFHFDHF